MATKLLCLFNLGLVLVKGIQASPDLFQFNNNAKSCVPILPGIGYGTCQTLGACIPYMSLDEKASSADPSCKSKTETCCIKKNCDLSGRWVPNGLEKGQYWCTNYQRPIRLGTRVHVWDPNDVDGSSVPILPFILPVYRFQKPPPCPGDITFDDVGSFITGGDPVAAILPNDIASSDIDASGDWKEQTSNNNNEIGTSSDWEEQDFSNDNGINTLVKG